VVACDNNAMLNLQYSLLGNRHVISPSRGCSNHQFTGGFDYSKELLKDLKDLM